MKEQQMRKAIQVKIKDEMKDAIQTRSPKAN